MDQPCENHIIEGVDPQGCQEDEDKLCAVHCIIRRALDVDRTNDEC